MFGCPFESFLLLFESYSSGFEGWTVEAESLPLGVANRARQFETSLTSYWNERKAHETGVLPISSGYTLGFWRGREERCQAQFL